MICTLIRTSETVPIRVISEVEICTQKYTIGISEIVLIRVREVILISEVSFKERVPLYTLAYLIHSSELLGAIGTWSWTVPQFPVAGGIGKQTNNL